MQLAANEIHIWSTFLTILPEEENQLLCLLSADEIARADKFRFPHHRRRFIVARGKLRQLLSAYLDLAPEKIIFGYKEQRKPYLLNPSDSSLQFNLSHSEELAIYALTLDHAIGVDIEKIQATYDAGIVKRFFSPIEQTAFSDLPEAEKCSAFYRVWTRKEALIKAVGKGLFLSLGSFSVSAQPETETVNLENDTWTLSPLSIHLDYQSTVASNQIVKKITYWNFLDLEQTPK